MDSQPDTSAAPCPTPRHSLGRPDRLFAAWMLLCLFTLAPVVYLMLSGMLAPFEDAQLRLLAGHPFYISAEEAQVALLSPVGTFCLCAGLTLWLAAVLLREPRLSRRSQVAFLAALALVLPGLMCVLWGGVLYVAAPLVCVLLLWCFTVLFAPLLRRFCRPSLS